MSKKGTARGRGMRIALTVLCVILGLILAGMLGVTAYINHLYSQMNYVDPDMEETISREEMEKLQQEEETDPSATGPTIDPEATLDIEHEIAIGGEGSELVNILLLGQDRRSGQGRGRTDVMLLCTFNKSTGRLTMTSFLRDSWVYIPGYGNQRLNAAYVFGGMSMLCDTLEENFGVHVDGVLEVDFTQFSRIIDTLGGVDLEISTAEAGEINQSCKTNLTGGYQHLSGAEALAYARIRSLDGDFNRTNRQRKVMTALVQKFKNSDLNTILDLLDQVLPMITTNMTQADMIGLATELFPMLEGVEIVSQSIPADGQYRLVMIQGMSVIELDMAAARELLDETLNQ